MKEIAIFYIDLNTKFYITEECKGRVFEGACSPIKVRFVMYDVYYLSTYLLGLHRISGRPDIWLFLISGIRPDIRFRLPDIRLAGYPARKTLHGIFFLQNLGLYEILQ